MRGVPIDKDMEYVGNFFTLLNPMSLLGGLTILGLSLTHGAFYLALKTRATSGVTRRPWARPWASARRCSPSSSWGGSA